MRLKDLTTIYVYESKKQNVFGETEIEWYFKGKTHLNKQQDISELDRNSAGEINYDIYKLRFDKEVIVQKENDDTFKTLEKNDGISFEELETDENGKLLNNLTPAYIVNADSKIDNAVTYTCVKYEGI